MKRIYNHWYLHMFYPSHDFIILKCITSSVLLLYGLHIRVLLLYGLHVRVLLLYGLHVCVCLPIHSFLVHLPLIVILDLTYVFYSYMDCTYAFGSSYINSGVSILVHVYVYVSLLKFHTWIRLLS